MKIETPTADLVRHVALNLRPRDRREVLAIRFSKDPADLVAEWAAMRPATVAEGIVAAADGEPVALIGIALVAPAMGSAHMIATNRWPEVAAAAHRFVRRVAFPRLIEPVFRRLECRCLEEHRVARRWLAALGFHEEGRHPALGDAGETYLTLGWVNPHWETRRVPE